jgi:hypothetical protein
LYSNLQTRPLAREGATKLQTRNCLKEISRGKKNWSQVPDGHLTPGQTGRLTVGRKLTATATSALVGSEWLASCSGDFFHKEEAHNTHCIEDWLGSRTVLDAMEGRKTCLCWDSISNPGSTEMWLEINFVIELNVFIITDYHYLKAF